MKLKITSVVLFLSLFYFKASSQCDGAQFEEQNGIVVIEMESGSLPSGWVRETGTSGYTGSSFIAWRGNDSFNTPGNGLIQYKIKINSPGKYRFQWRSKTGIGTLASEHNDSWLKFPDAFDFYAQNGTSIKYPNGGTFKKSNVVVNGASSNGWMKIFTTNAVSSFSWTTLTSDNNGHSVYAEFTSAGVYTIQVSARSKGHFIDRLVLYKETSYTASSATTLSRVQTTCGSGTTPPPPPPPPTPPTGAPAIASVQYINADTESVLGNLVNGTQINLSSINNDELTFRATTNPTTIGSVRFQLTGPRNWASTDNSVPYSLVGEAGVNKYKGLALPVGNYTLKLTPYSGSSLSGTKGTEVTVTFAVINNTTTPPPPPPPPTTTANFSFFLVNSTTDQDISTLTNGRNVTSGSNINVRAVPRFTNTASVYFVVQGPTSRTFTENVAPYALFGDINGNYNAGSLANGSYSLTATAYSGRERTGTNLGSTTVTFTVGTTTSSSTAKVAAFAYPNPIEDSKVSVKLPQKEYGLVNYSLSNSSGIEVETGKAQIFSNEDEAEVNLSSFDRIIPGVYYLTVHSLNGTYTIPLIKK